MERNRRDGVRDGVLICGAYGFGNAGDDAILQAIIGEMRRIDAHMPVTVISRRPKDTRSAYGVNACNRFHYLAIRRVLRRSQLFISGGGSLMQDVTSRMSLWYYLSTIRLAHRCGCKVQMYGCGIGPIVYERRAHHQRLCGQDHPPRAGQPRDAQRFRRHGAGGHPRVRPRAHAAGRRARPHRPHPARARYGPGRQIYRLRTAQVARH